VGHVVGDWDRLARSALGDPYTPYQLTCEGCGETHTRIYATSPSGKVRNRVARFCKPCKKLRDCKRHAVNRVPRIIVWTDERKELAARLWREGQTCRQIAAVIGGVSRNAVIGIIHRLGLSGLQPKQQAKSPEERRIKNAEKRQRYRSKLRFTRSSPAIVPRVKAGAFVPYTDAPPVLSIIKPYEECVTMEGLKPHHCRFPVDGDGPMRYCGEDKSFRSYCLKHHVCAHRQ
jgi:GcrA cell cycle regulator